MKKIEVKPMTGEAVKGDVRKAAILAALPNPYDLMLKAEGVKAVDIIFFGQGEQKSASEIVFDDDKPIEEGKVHPHHHDPGEMEVIICFMEDGRMIVNQVDDGYEHVYPDGVKFAIAVKCTARTVEQAFGTIRNISSGVNNTD